MGAKGSGINREKERLEKIDWILTLIGKKKIAKMNCLGQIQLKYGTSRRTALDYINVLLNTNMVKEVCGILKVI